MKNKTLFVVIMNRWGEPFPSHSYVEGIYDDIELAQKNGKKEQQNRDNKYEPVIQSFIVNESKELRLLKLKKSKAKSKATPGKKVHFPKNKKKKKIIV